MVLGGYVGGLVYRVWDKKQGGVRLRERGKLDAEQFLCRAEIEQLQVTRLKELLEYAAENSPWYQELFKNQKFVPSEIVGLQDLENLPVTTKYDIRNNLKDFISRQYSTEELVSAKTGGSTGVSLTLYFDELCQKKRNAAQAMSDGWAKWRPGAQVAALWGNPPVAKTIKQKLRSALLERMVYLDTMSVNTDSVITFYKTCLNQQPSILFGHAHSIYLFAKKCKELGLDSLSFDGVISTSMMLLAHERDLIERVFEVKVFNRYGCEEVGLIASECDRHDGMHINESHVIVECLDDDNQPVPYGEPGKIVVTDLNNYGMPLIRYRVEDVGVLNQEQCACGRTTTLLKRLEGRVADFLLDTDGALVAGVSLVERTLTKVAGIEQMQLVQEVRDEIVVNRVKGKEHSTETDLQLLEELEDAFSGNIQFKLVDCATISQERNGKFRFSICKL